MPAMAPTVTAPRVRLRNGCSLTLVISSTMRPMPMRAAAISRGSLAAGAAAATRAEVLTSSPGGGRVVVGWGGSGRDRVVRQVCREARHHVVDGGGEVGDLALLVGSERLEVGELGGDQRGRHEVAGAP